MAPFWEYAASQLNIPIDKTKFQTLKGKNEKRLEEIDKEIEDAEKNLGKKSFITEKQNVQMSVKIFLDVWDFVLFI